MSTPIQGAVIRATSFPRGMASVDDVERLAYLLNPVLQQVQQLSQNGVNARANLDGQVIDFQIKTPADPFTAPAFGANWSAYPGFMAPGYYKNAAGEIKLRGLYKATAGVGATSTLAVLPAGYRPNAILSFTCMANVAGADAQARVQVDTAGNITLFPAALINSYVSLDGVSFLASDGGPGALSCFPAQVRISDGRRPTGVLLLACDDNQPGNPSATPNSGATTPSVCSAGLSWSYVGTGTGKPNLMTIDNIPGLALGRTYNVRILVLF